MTPDIHVEILEHQAEMHPSLQTPNAVGKLMIFLAAVGSLSVKKRIESPEGEEHVHCLLYGEIIEHYVFHFLLVLLH